MEICDGKKQHQASKSSRSSSPVSPGNSGEPRPGANTPPSPCRVGPPPSPPVPTHPVAPVAPEPAGPVNLTPCQICGRTFLPESLAKHAKVCEKVICKKRKTFDSSRQRREGTDLAQFLPKNFGLPENSPFLEKSPPVTAKPVPKLKPSVKKAISKPTADLERCPHCNRAFGPRAFERHVEWCADKAKILPAATATVPAVADAKQRLNARTQYKAPLARGRRSSQSRDKSNSRSQSVESARGTSPPPPPPDAGDYRQPRARASESASSTDYHEDHHHVPVIRNSLGSRNNSSGDAHVKARQARLARDLSSTRKSPKPSTSQALPNIEAKVAKETAQRKTKNKFSLSKEQQLKKLEDEVQKYMEKANRIKEEIKIEETECIQPISYKPVRKTGRSMIPVPRKGTQQKSEDCKTFKSINERNVVGSDAKTRGKTIARPKIYHNKDNDKDSKKINESFSLDSLEVPSDHSVNKKDNNENSFMCSAIPCTIYATEKPKCKERNIKKHISKSDVESISDNLEDDPKIKVLYENPAMAVQKQDKEIELEVKYSPISGFINSLTTVSTSGQQNVDEEESLENEEPDGDKTTLHQDDTSGIQNIYSDSNIDMNENNLSTARNQDIEIHDISDVDETIDKPFADSLEYKENYDQNVPSDNDVEVGELKGTSENENKNDEVARHGSSETYTKFTEHLSDLEEFMTITDQIISEQDMFRIEDFDQEKDICIDLHTPATASIETMGKDKTEMVQMRPEFSNTLGELKKNLKELIDTSESEAKKAREEAHIDLTLKIPDAKEIDVVTPIHSSSPQSPKVNTVQTPSSDFKLPSINDNNKIQRKSASRNKKFQKLKKPMKVKEKTYIKESEDNSDNQSITADAPPLKLPRIEDKRVDDYDPFLSAARQMKELMSSETNIPQKLNSSTKDHTRTLPALRTNKDKLSLSYHRQDNTKTMKDSLNRTYQKTPTLQRMKSFGSTNNDNITNTPFGARCSSFRINRSNKNSSQSLNTTFTKSSKENISTLSSSFTRNNLMNRSFSSYNNSAYSTPKPRDKIPKISTSMSHSFQRSTIKQPVKTEKPNKDKDKKEFVNLDSILASDTSSIMTDSNYIDPRLINETDNLPINVNTIRNNPDIISSMESLLTTENLPAKFDSFANVQNNNQTINSNNKIVENLTNNNTTELILKSTAPTLDELTSQYDKIMSSLEQSTVSKTSIRDDDSLCEDFDLEEFMTSFDDEIKQKTRICSSTTRIIKQSELADDNKKSEKSSYCSTPKIVHSSSNGSIPFNKSMSLTFSSNSIAGESLFPSSVKRSTSLLDSIKKNTLKGDGAKSRLHSDQLEQDIMKSLKDFDRFYEPDIQTNRETTVYNANVVVNGNATTKRELRAKSEKKTKKPNEEQNGYTAKSSNDSAYSSLNRISPSKLSVCNSRESNGVDLERIPAGSESGDSHRGNGIRSVSSDEFLAMERSAEIELPDANFENNPLYAKEIDAGKVFEKRASSRISHRAGRRNRASLSSSGSESSVAATRDVARDVPRDAPREPPRLSRFCHECGSKFPVDTAKFCIECGCKRLAV